MSTGTITETKTCRLLYYGASGAGKRDNLRLINQSLPPENRLSLASADPERQIAFKMQTEKEGAWQVLVQAVDAGKEPLPTAGRGHLPSFDGVVFVLSSAAPHLDQSLASLEALKSFLDAWGLDLMTVPVVIQYNGRDASDALPLDRLESLINPWGLLSYPSSTRRGEGVRETLKSILGLTVNHVQQRILSPGNPLEGISGDGGGLTVESGPPVPGSEDIHTLIEAAVEEQDPHDVPLVVPVRIPREKLQSGRPLRILVEILPED